MCETNLYYHHSKFLLSIPDCMLATCADLETKLSKMEENQLESATSLEVTCTQLDLIANDARHCCRRDNLMHCFTKATADLVGMDTSTIGDCPDCPSTLAFAALMAEAKTLTNA